LRLIVGLVLVVGAGGFAVVRLAPCTSSEAPFDGFVASVERWLEVVPPFPSTTDGTPRANDRTFLLDLLVRPVGEEGVAGPATRERVAIHDSFIGDIERALGDGSDVFLAFTSEGLVRQEVSFVVARQLDGTHAFLGGCWSESGSAWLRERLGDGYDKAMDKVIGSTDPDRIERLLLGPQPPRPEQPPILAPGDAPARSLDRLDLFIFQLITPTDWRGDMVLCTHVAEGWNDCVPLAQRGSDIGAYIGRDRRLEVWLLPGSARLEGPKQLLGTINLGRHDDVVEGGGLVIFGIGGDLTSTTTSPYVLGPSVEVQGACLLNPSVGAFPCRPS